ncbi:MAG: hypothetical protein V3U67_07340 [Gemmatimonadota bacterium]
MKRILTTLVLGSLLVATSAQAQTTASQTARINVPSILFIGFTGDVDFGAAADADFTAGFKDVAGFTLTHRGNILHDVTVEADQAVFNKDGVAGVKPASDLLYDMDGAGLVAMPVAPVLLQNAAPVGLHTKNFDFRVLLSLVNDSPGLYELPFTFTVSPD